MRNRTDTAYTFVDPSIEIRDLCIPVSLRVSVASPAWKEWTLRCGDRENHEWRQFQDPDDGDDKVRAQVDGVEQLVVISSRWLRTCQDKHKHCQRQSTQHPEYLPTRLLDVGPRRHCTIKLVLGEDLRSTRSTAYLTLSYCWGKGNDAARTTSANLDQRLQGIPLTSLPPSLQDTITLTRVFGVRYLWIDALCILQKDGGQDWQREVSNIGRIYGNSQFTIAASSAADSSHGLLRRRFGVERPVEDYRLVCQDSSGTAFEEVLLGATLPQWDTAVEGCNLFTRGWVLQERMLTSRTLHWTDVGVFWECSEIRGSEYKERQAKYEEMSSHLRLSEHAQMKEYYGMLEGLAGIGQDDNSHLFSCQNESWYYLLEEFSAKNLTCKTDRLPAITALGQEVARLTGKAFEIGVCKHNLVQGLAWMTGFHHGYHRFSNKQAVRRIPGFPSWCWASVDRPLLFRSDVGNFALARTVHLDRQSIHVRSRLGRLQLRSLSETPINLTRCNRRAKVRNCAFKPRRSCANTPINVDGNVYDEFAVFDTLSETPPGGVTTITCVQWREWEYWATFPAGSGLFTVTGALIIDPTEEGRNIYRRIGWLEIFDTDFFDKEPQDIVLV